MQIIRSTLERQPLSSASRRIRRYFLPSLVDGLLVVAAFYAALSLRFSGNEPLRYLRQTNFWVPFFVLVYIASNHIWQIYDRLWLHATAHDNVALADAVGFATLLILAINLLWPLGRPLPTSQILLGGLLTFMGMLLARYRRQIFSHLHDQRPQAGADRRLRTLIVGAGDHGGRLAEHLHDDPTQRSHYEPIGFVDDDPDKQGLHIHGLRVLGCRHDIPTIVRKYAVDQIIIASPATFGNSFDELVAICQSTSVQIKTVPRFCDILDGNGHSGNLRPLTIEDLLGRTPVCVDQSLCQLAVAERTVLVTGAGGSIGSELSRQLLRLRPRRLLLLDNNETALHDVERELAETRPSDCPTEVACLLADITNARKIEAIYRREAPQIVFHAAAYKHVPMMETNADEAVRVNVLGTMILSDLADRYRVERFVLISTDKAVNPSCVMGASKRLGELWIAALQQTSRTCFSAVRFGNVVGSRGSVIPIFERQIERGGPVTVTDPRMTRYFMSIPEAASLIIQTGALSDRGGIYMLDMGEPVSIVELAHKMIRLRGLRPGSDIRIKYIGVRPGEKLHEELAYHTERTTATIHPKIHRLEDGAAPERQTLLGQIAVLAAAMESTKVNGRLGKAVLLAAAGDVDGLLEMLAGIPLRHYGEGRRATRALPKAAEPALPAATPMLLVAPQPAEQPSWLGEATIT